MGRIGRFGAVVAALLVLGLGACTAVDRAVAFGYDQVQAGMLTPQEFGERVLYVEGAERDAREKVVGASVDILGILTNLGLIGAGGISFEAARRAVNRVVTRKVEATANGSASA